MKLSDLWRRKPKQKTWVPTDQGLMNTNWDLGWWQQNLQPAQPGGNETVEACVSALAQTVAMCPIHHLRDSENGEQTRQIGSGPERALLNPNE
jgi:phage portal protein BeeE